MQMSRLRMSLSKTRHYILTLFASLPNIPDDIPLSTLDAQIYNSVSQQTTSHLGTGELTATAKTVVSLRTLLPVTATTLDDVLGDSSLGHASLEGVAVDHDIAGVEGLGVEEDGADLVGRFGASSNSQWGGNGQGRGAEGDDCVGEMHCDGWVGASKSKR
jgi:hypothetical protein